VFPVKFESAILNGLLERAQRLHKALIANEKPDPDAEPWECKFCEFKGECSESRVTENVGEGVPLRLSLCLSEG
jgi:hypothetical protein